MLLQLRLIDVVVLQYACSLDQVGRFLPAARVDQMCIHD